MIDLTSAIQAASFYLIPALIGAVPLSVVYASRIAKKNKDNGFYPLFVFFNSFATGALIIYGAAYTLFYLAGQNKIVLLKPVISFLTEPLPVFIRAAFLFIVTAFAVGYYLRKTIPNKEGLINIAKNLGVVVTLLAISIFVYAIWRFNSPINTTLNWDLYHHQTLATEIVEGQFDVKPSIISDSFQFDAYTTLFHTLLAIPQKLHGTDILNFWWHLEFFHLFTTVFASFLVGYAFTNKKNIGLISGIVGAFIFESLGAYTSLFLIPQNLTATMGAALIARTVYKFNNKQRYFDVITIAYMAFIILNHFIIGFLTLVLVITTLVYLYIAERQKTDKVEYAIVFLTVISTLVVPLLTHNINLDYINRGEAGFFNFTFSQKWEFVKDFYGYLFVLLPFGVVYAIAKRRSSTASRLLTILSIGSITILFASLPYTLKLYSLGRYFVNALIALGFWQILRHSKPFAKVLYTGTLIVVLTGIFLANIITFKQVPNYKDVATHVTEHEIEAANFIRENYKTQRALIVSEPATMHVLDTLSTVNSPAGAYATSDTRRILHQIYISRDSEKMSEELFKIEDLVEMKNYDKVLLVVGKRFEIWQNESTERKFGIYYNVWKPYDLTLQELESLGFIDFVRSNTNFKEIFSNEGVIIFEVTR